MGFASRRGMPPIKFIARYGIFLIFSSICFPTPSPSSPSRGRLRSTVKRLIQNPFEIQDRFVYVLRRTTPVKAKPTGSNPDLLKTGTMPVPTNFFGGLWINAEICPRLSTSILPVKRLVPTWYPPSYISRPRACLFVQPRSSHAPIRWADRGRSCRCDPYGRSRVRDNLHHTRRPDNDNL